MALKAFLIGKIISIYDLLTLATLWNVAADSDARLALPLAPIGSLLLRLTDRRFVQSPCKFFGF